MNRRKTLTILLATLLVFACWSCNSDDTESEYETAQADWTNVSVKSFSLGKNDSVLEHLDTVFFSIDLDRAVIFNADSLPVGTKLKKSTVSLTLPTVSRAMLLFMGTSGRDSVDYLNSSSDSVNFANGPVTLSLTSLDGTITRDYTITVNVHKIEPDSMEWSRSAARPLPTSLTAPTASQTVEWQSRYYCLTTDGASSVMAVASAPDQDNWDMQSINLPRDARVNTLTPTTEAIYILADGNNLYRSADGGQSWSMTGAHMDHIYGAYGDQLLGNLFAGSRYVALSYPDSFDPETASPLPDGCPVRGTSNTIVYATEWSDHPMLITVGGATADGSLTGCTWAYDGSEWANVSIDAGLPREGMSLVPYFSFRNESFWEVTSYSALFAIGGSDSNGNNDNKVYVSLDRGVHWSVASASVQLPAYIAPFSSASSIVANTLLGSRSSSVWKEYGPASLNSRASQMITQWECPYIYFFGGIDNSGKLVDKVWRGVINRLTFRPLQ